MSRFILAVFLGIILLVIGFVLFRREQKRICISMDNIFILFYILTFGVVFPMDLLYSVTTKNDSTYLNLIASFTGFELLFYYVCITVFLIVFVYSFRIFVGNTTISVISTKTNNNTKGNLLFFIIILLLLIGVVSDILYLSAYGSYFNYLEYSGALRSGVMRVENKWSFLIVFRGCVLFASILLFGTIKTNGKYSILKIILFIFAFVHSLFILFANKGRLSLVLYILIFPFIIFLRRYKKDYIDFKLIVFGMIIIAVFSVLIVLVGQLLSRSDNEDLLYAMVSESSFVFGNFKALISNRSSYDYRLFLDVVSYPIFILPSSIWGKLFPITASDICTLLVYGSIKGSNGVYGESPCDIISLGYLQLNIVGIFICAVILGAAVGLIFKGIGRIKNTNLKNTLAIYLSIYLLCQSVFYCDPYNVVQRMFPTIVFMLLYLFFSLLSPTEKRVVRK